MAEKLNKGPIPPSEFKLAMTKQVEEYFASQIASQDKFKGYMEEQIKGYFSAESEKVKKGDKEMKKVIKKFFKDLENK